MFNGFYRYFLMFFIGFDFCVLVLLSVLCFLRSVIDCLSMFFHILLVLLLILVICAVVH